MTAFIQLLKTVDDISLSEVYLQVRSLPAGQSTYNKFLYVEELLPILHTYDYFMMLSAEMNAVGFPWKTWFARQQARNSVITGTVRQNKRETFTGSRDTQYQLTTPFCGWVWKRSWDEAAEFSLRESFLSDIVPQYFAVLDCQFAEWFFKYALQDGLLYEAYQVDGEQEVVKVPYASSYGIDNFWCGAASQWLQATRTDFRMGQARAETHASMLNGDQTNRPKYKTACSMATTVMDRIAESIEDPEGIYRPEHQATSADFKNIDFLRRWWDYSYFFRESWSHPIEKLNTWHEELLNFGNCCTFHQYC
jgi:hypothetical protein